MDKNSSSSSDMELLKTLLRDQILASGDMSASELGFVIDDMYIASIEDGVVSVAVPNSFLKSFYLRNGVDKLYAKHLSMLLQDNLEVTVFIDQSIYPLPLSRLIGYYSQKAKDRAEELGMTLEEYNEYKAKKAAEGDIPNFFKEVDSGKNPKIIQDEEYDNPYGYVDNPNFDAGILKEEIDENGETVHHYYSMNQLAGMADRQAIEDRKKRYEQLEAEFIEREAEKRAREEVLREREEIIRERQAQIKKELEQNEADSDFDPSYPIYREPIGYKRDYTFDSFVVGDSNKVAHAFALFVAEHPGDRAHNPLYIYGPPGVGKTHLMYAICNRILEKDPATRIEYIKGEDFVNLFVEMIHAGRAVEFREKYRGSDVLIIDDVQFIAGKEATEEELFHTFNSLFEDNKQIVFTADKLPREMIGISKRFESRLEGGVMADIQLPEYELRLAILRNKAQTRGLNLSDDVEDFLVRRLTSSIRQIEGVVNKLSGMTFITDEVLTIDTVRQRVPEYLNDSVPTEDVVKNVIAACAKYYNVSAGDVLGERRDKEIQQARNAAMYIIRSTTNLSTVKIGEIFGRKYTTVISNCKTVATEMEKKPSFASEIEQMIRNSRS